MTRHHLSIVVSLSVAFGMFDSCDESMCSVVHNVAGVGLYGNVTILGRS